ncbi:glycosyltransferase [Acetobacter conturbans]|uniref:Glycosyltransferase n=1 Tax=Acetobacter conturbans TaxID=1737472 RepID=A0ABX0JX63_9PROT|nr:glycosyltransferase [Acetobacter conturbans]NHN87141.1 glycosyltransferase [Acetobacter conturbans]
MFLKSSRVQSCDRAVEDLVSSSFFHRPRIVAIPACNEEEHIVPCLLALADQGKYRPDKVVVWINNTDDSTVERASAVRGELPFLLEIVEVRYAPASAHAGRARHDAMAHAARHAPHDALLFTTDADGEVARDWMRCTLEAFTRYDVAAVFGRALLLPGEAGKIPPHLHEDEAAEQVYGALLDQIGSLIDPDPHDPWPRHTEHSGASIAVTYEAWARVGGIPFVASGEDRAFYTALRLAELPVRHAPEVKVYVSARLVGRAAGGMAETIARRILRQDEYVDDVLEAVSTRLLRIRRAAGRQRKGVTGRPVLPALPDAPVRIPRQSLPLHHRRAQRVLDFLKQRVGETPVTAGRGSGDRCDRMQTVPYDPLSSDFHGSSD